MGETNTFKDIVEGNGKLLLLFLLLQFDFRVSMVIRSLPHRLILIWYFIFVPKEETGQIKIWKQHSYSYISKRYIALRKRKSEILGFDQDSNSNVK